MQITKKSMLTGITHTKEIDVTHAMIEAWEGGVLIQNAMPHLDVDDREFMISGSTPEEWDHEYGEDA